MPNSSLIVAASECRLIVATKIKSYDDLRHATLETVADDSRLRGGFLVSVVP